MSEAAQRPRLPGPRGLPLLGNLPEYALDPLRFIERARAHGRMVHLTLGRYESYALFDPVLIEQVLVTDNRCYRKDYFLQMLTEVVGNGLLTSEGVLWRRQRRLAQPAFHRERVNAYGALVVAATEEFVAELAPGMERDLHEDMMRLTLHIVARALFSSDVGDAAGRVGQALHVIMSRYADQLFLMFPQLARLPLPMNRRFAQAMQALDEIVYGLIRARREKRPAGAGADLLSMLLDAKDEEGSGMTDRQLRDEVITLFLAGHETTALVLSYTFYLLSRHGQVVARIEEEIREVLSGRLPTAEDLPRLRYLEQVIKESMRLYPPAWSIGREALVEVEVGGHRLPAGTQLWISQWATHRDPEYFPDPLSFRPERWEEEATRRLPRYAYFPFGGGPRMCIGSSFAMMEAVLVMATILSRYRLEVLPRPKLVLVPSVTLRPKHGLRARVVRAP